MPQLDKSIQDLCEKGTELAEQSDKLKELIRSTNEQLAEAGIGVFTWAGDAVRIDKEQGAALHLGWARIQKRGWELAIIGTSIDDDGRERFDRDVVPTPLINTALELRVDAVRCLPDLIAALTSIVEDRLNQFEPIQNQIEDVVPRPDDDIPF